MKAVNASIPNWDLAFFLGETPENAQHCPNETLWKRRTCYTGAIMCKQPGSSAAEHGNNPGSQLFTLRLWAEELDAGRFEWRGRLQHMNSGQVRYFRDATTLYAALRAMLEEL